LALSLSPGAAIAGVAAGVLRVAAAASGNFTAADIANGPFWGVFRRAGTF
jgi:hypothetical protein